MTLIEAVETLQPPLLFADERQIKAHEFWVGVLLAADHYNNCIDCVHHEDEIEVRKARRLSNSLERVCAYPLSVPDEVWTEARRVAEVLL